MKILKNAIYVLFFIAGCAGSTSSEIESRANSNIIDLAASFKSIQTVRLSEIADSVSFIPFETTSQSLMGSRERGIRFSIQYIFFLEKCFDWTGKYIGSIVKRGQGPFEEPEGGSLVYNNNHFYSKGTKFIEYDMAGKPTGKVRNLYAAREYNTDEILRSSTGFSAIKDNFIIYEPPSTLYFIDSSFEIISSRKVIQTDSLFYSGASYPGVTYYKDTVIFYNCINDTIFHVADTGLVPKWIVNFDHPLRLFDVRDNDERKLSMDNFMRAVHGQTSFDNVEGIKNADGKHSVIAAYETESRVFFLMKENIGYAVLRGLTPPDPYIVYHDKNTGKITRVQGKGFVDDMLGMDYFYPQLGIFNEKMITSIWPYELFDYIEACKERGREVNPQLLALSKQLKEDDNPVLILVHLKKQT